MANATNPRTLLTAEEVLSIAEAKAAKASTPYQRNHAAVMAAIYISDIADFRHHVRYAAPGAVLHISGTMGQFDHYTCLGELSDGTRIYSAEIHPGIPSDEWSAIVD